YERATAEANGEGYLRCHLRAVIAHLQRHPGLELLAIGFGAGIEQDFPQAVRLRSPQELATVLTEKPAARLVEPLHHHESAGGGLVPIAARLLVFGRAVAGFSLLDAVELDDGHPPRRCATLQLDPAAASCQGTATVLL